MIIGITGTDGAGKGTVVDYLVNKKGFTHYSSRALLTAELEKAGREATRENMRLIANELRAQMGSDALVQIALKEIEENKIEDAVIESIRTMGEVETLKNEGGILLAVDAEQKLRYKRITGRGSSSDKVSFEDFVAHEALEMNDPDPSGMQKAAVMKAADITVTNNGHIHELHAFLEKWLEQFVL